MWNPICGDKTIIRSLYQQWEFSHTGKIPSLYWISPRLQCEKWWLMRPWILTWCAKVSNELYTEKKSLYFLLHVFTHSDANYLVMFSQSLAVKEIKVIFPCLYKRDYEIICIHPSMSPSVHPSVVHSSICSCCRHCNSTSLDRLVASQVLWIHLGP